MRTEFGEIHRGFCDPLLLFIAKSWSWNESDGVFVQVSEIGNGGALETVAEATGT